MYAKLGIINQISSSRRALPVHVVHPICCKIEALDLGVTRFKGAGGKQSQLFWQANIYSEEQVNPARTDTPTNVKRLVHSLLLATFAGPVDLKLGKTDETFGLFILNRKELASKLK